jgi:hypothetical protein
MNNSPFTINKYKVELFHLEDLVKQYDVVDLSGEYCPYKLTKLQTYNPIYSKLFQVDSELSDIGFNNRFQFASLTQVVDTTTGANVDKSVFIKFSPLLDPLRYMVGKYNKEDYDNLYYLPNPSIIATNNPTEIITQKMNREQKLNNSNNASYIDCFFNYLSSQLLNTHNIVNGINYYGSYLGIQEKFKLNITDDYEYVHSSTFFNNKLNNLFQLDMNGMEEHYLNNGSRNNKMNIKIGHVHNHNISAISTISLTDEINNNTCGNETIEEVYEKHSCKNTSNTQLLTPCVNTLSSTNTSNNSEINYSSSDDDSDCDSSSNDDGSNDISSECDSSSNDSSSKRSYTNDDDSDSSTSDSGSSCYSSELESFAYIYNFPVQMICIEKCDGTLDELFNKGVINNEIGISILMQIIMTLIIYQKLFNFTHNDLHTNNIMYVNTDVEYLYYTFNNNTYQVPTYGKIVKLIDFGRSIYTFQNKLYCSDSFALDGDAATQYNFEPYINRNKELINPNYSVDLCRLACSIYEYVINDDDTFEEMDNFQKMIYSWCMDDNNKNVLYKKNGDERYPNFKLYKMIARTVHKHIPKSQLKHSIFKQFVCKVNPPNNLNEPYVNIDNLPVYA